LAAVTSGIDPMVNKPPSQTRSETPGVTPAATAAEAKPSSAPASHTTHDRPTQAPSDNTTLVEVLAGYRDAGFDASFVPEEGGTVFCESCNTTLDAARLEMQSLRRLEGASDPDDMVAVVALECPVCGRAGTMVLGFGPAASAADHDVMRSIQDHRSDDRGTLPAGAAPGESVDDIGGDDE
jgi:hypothetical protein